jgi:hypothetical protein
MQGAASLMSVAKLHSFPPSKVIGDGLERSNAAPHCLAEISVTGGGAFSVALHPARGANKTSKDP